MSFGAGKAQYDCLIDSLPDWVPGAIKKELEEARNLVLDVWGYEPREAIKWIEYYSEDYVSEDIPDYPTVSPSGTDINLALFDRTMAFLSRTRQAIDLGPVEGLEYFGGKFAYLSYGWLDNLRWDIKEKTAQPEDVELMMVFFVICINRMKAYPPKYSASIRVYSIRYLASISIALGETRSLEPLKPPLGSHQYKEPGKLAKEMRISPQILLGITYAANL